jgi:hypothetical protein
MPPCLAALLYREVSYNFLSSPVQDNTYEIIVLLASSRYRPVELAILLRLDIRYQEKWINLGLCQPAVLAPADMDGYNKYGNMFIHCPSSCS